MASSNSQPILRHFLDPQHSLWQTLYGRDEVGLCSLCLLKLAGSNLTYGCYSCNIHIHSACARHFQETISFFPHPAHPLKLRRSPGRACDICGGFCPRESFVYSCKGCDFNVHPLCSLLPERVASPFDARHRLCMSSSESPGSCTACHHPLPRWHYIGGGSSLKLHVACASVDTPITGAGQGSSGHAAVAQDSHGAVSQRSFGAPAPAYSYKPSTAGSIQGYGHTDGAIQSSYYGGAAVVQGAPVKQRGFGAGHPAAAGYNPGIQQGYGSYYYVPPTIQGGFGGYGHAGQYYYVPPIQCGVGGYGPPIHPSPIRGIYYGHAMPSTSSGGGHGGSGSGKKTSRLLMGGIAKFLVGTAISALVGGDLLSVLLSGS